MKPFYEHPDGITLYAGDCIEVMRELAENSVDAVVTDPPYGLEFMGEDWDAPWKQGGDVVADAEGEGGFQDGSGGNPFSRSRIRYGHKSGASHAEARTKRADELDDPSKGRYIRAGVNAYDTGLYSKAKAGMPGGSFSAVDAPSHFGGLNPKCRNCDKWQRGANPCSCEKPDFPNERRIRGSMFEDWCYDWATEALRVLKPGGYILAFGGSRTWHRLACAIEDAGFEIRDSLAFIHLQGFPKSRDVTEAMTRYLAEGPTRAEAADLADLRAVTTFLREARDAAGWTNAQIDALFGTNGMAGHWTTAGSQPRCPSLDEWAKLRDALVFDDRDIIELVQRLAATNRPEDWGEGGNGQRFLGALEYDDEAPRAGRYGTAWKPAMEPVVCARKPLIGSVANNIAAYGVGCLDIDAGRIATDDVTTAAGEAPGRWPANVVLDETAAETAELMLPGSTQSFLVTSKAPQSERPVVDGVSHPTVKSLKLMRWLIRMVTPSGGTVLEPFSGSGTTAEACLLERRSCIAIEKSSDYLPLTVARLEREHQHGFDLEWRTS